MGEPSVQLRRRRVQDLKVVFEPTLIRTRLVRGAKRQVVRKSIHARVSVRAAEDFPFLARKARQYFRLANILFLYLVGCCVGAWSPPAMIAATPLGRYQTVTAKQHSAAK